MKIINIEGVGDVPFPSDATDEQISQFVNSTSKEDLAAIAAAAKAQQTPDTLGRELGLFGRAAAGSIMSGLGLANMVVDPAFALAGQKTPSQYQQELLTRMGFPEPRNPTERVVQDVTGALTSTAGLSRAAAQYGPKAITQTGKYIAEQLASNPQAQASVAMASSGAAGMGRESGLSPNQQLLLAMGAGTLAPGGGSLPTTQRVTSAGKAIVSPFTQAGREAITGNVLNRLAYNPERAAMELESSAPLVPGVRPTTAAVARDPGLAGAETAIRGLDTTNAFGARLSANQQALMNEFKAISGTPETMSLAKSLRTRFTAPVRDFAFSNDQVTPEMFGSLKTLFVDKAVKAIQDSDVGVRQDVENAMKWTLNRLDNATTPKQLYEVRKDLAGAALGKYNKDNPSLQLARGQLVDVIGSIDNLLGQTNPGYAKYMQKFQAWSQPLDRMRLMQGIEQKVTTGQPNLMTGEPVLGASQLRNQLAAKSEELGVKLSAPMQQRLDNVISEINRGQAATAPGIKVPGSDTFRNMSVGNLIGKVMSQSLADNKTLRTMARPLDWLYKLPDEAMQQLLVDAMLDPQLAAKMMKNANIMEIDSVAKSLRTKAERLGYGGMIGAEEAMK